MILFYSNNSVLQTTSFDSFHPTSSTVNIPEKLVRAFLRHIKNVFLIYNKIFYGFINRPTHLQQSLDEYHMIPAFV
jgi:hypothetical protein